MDYQFSWHTTPITEHQVIFSRNPQACPSKNEGVQIGGYSYSLKGAAEDISLILDAIWKRTFTSSEEFQEALKEIPSISNHKFQKISHENKAVINRIAEVSPFSRVRTEDVLPKELMNYFKAIETHPAFLGVLSVSWGDRKPMSIIAHGNIQQDPLITAETLFNIMSAGKAFTAAAILQLVEKGDILLDTPLDTPLIDIELSDDAFQLTDGDEKYRYDLCPNSEFYNNVQQAIESFKQNKKVTIGHLLKHQAGLLDDKDVKGLRFQEGEIGHYHYSNYGYQILARIISKKTNIPFSSYISENVFKPSGAEGSVLRVGPEPTPHICVMGQLQPNKGPLEKTRVPDADGNGCWWMTARNLEKIALAFTKGDLFKKELGGILTTPLETSVDHDLIVARCPGILFAPDHKSPAIVFQGTHEGRSAVAVVITGGEETLSVSGVFNSIDGGNLWADLVEIYRGKTIEKPLEKFAHFTERTEASKELFRKLSENPPNSKESMKEMLVQFAKLGVASQYHAISAKLEEEGHILTANLIREADQELRQNSL